VTRRAWTACGIVFVASAGTLVLEIAAGRLLASYFGVSLYTWTGIIGVILAGIALGNYLGGAVADQAGSRRTLGLVLATAGLASLAILPFTTIELLALAPSGLPVVVRMVLITALLFFLPSAKLGMVSPLVVKRALADITRAGAVVGRILPRACHRPDARRAVHGVSRADAPGGVPARVRAVGRGRNARAASQDVRGGGERGAARARLAPGDSLARAGRGDQGRGAAAGRYGGVAAGGESGRSDRRLRPPPTT
jgi:hypothetical protein